MSNFQVERLRKLPRRPDETWQGGWVQLPSWVASPGEKPFRPWAPLWVSRQTQALHAGMLCQPEQKNTERALDALAELACHKKRAGYRPGRLEVNSPELAQDLSGRLAELGLEVKYSEELPHLEQLVEWMLEDFGGGQAGSGALDVPGVTVDRMRSFAEAAKVFYEARPWEYLTDEDLIHIEKPQGQEGLRCVTVLGAGGNTYGLGFFDSPDDYWRMQETADDPEAYYTSQKSGSWSLLFCTITELPLGDADLWEDHELAVAGEDAYPCMLCYLPGHGIRRPSPDALSFLEGLLRVFAATTEDEIDSGRWTRRADVSDGPVTFTLSLPDLLAPPKPKELIDRGIMPDRRAMERMFSQMDRYFAEHPASDADEMTKVLNREFAGKTIDEMEFTPRTPLEQAQDLCYQAFDARGRRQLQLARKALETCPDCADAYVILAERTSDVQKACELYASGVSAGEKVLGKERFEEDEGHFWGVTDTRPYMHHRLGLAQSLQELGRVEEAVGHYQEMLRLNPNDHQGVRYLLLPRLIELDRDPEAAALISESADEETAIWAYCRVLLAFRRDGATSSSAKLLRRAIKTNRHVPKYLLGTGEPPPDLPDNYALGSVEEAILCAAELVAAWNSTSGADEWLQEETKAHKPPKRRKRRKRRKRG